MQEHLTDTCLALSVLTDLSAKTLLAMDAPELIRLIRSLWDKELAAFFVSAGTAPQAKSSAKSPA